MLTLACQLTVEDFALLGIPVTHLVMAMQASIHCLRLAITYNHTSPHKTLEKLESNQIIGVTEACWLNVVESIKEQKVFEHEDDMVDKALNLLKAYEGLHTVEA